MTDRYLVPWTGAAYRHIPADAGRDVLDFDLVGRATDNRWNAHGEPTLYLAGDPGVVVTEWGRNFGGRRAADVGASSITRAVFRLSLRLRYVLDLRDLGVVEALELSGVPECFLDRQTARTLARLLRTTTSAQAMLVPSIAFLDDLTRWNLVVFLDKVPANLSEWIHQTEYVGPLRWR